LVRDRGFIALIKPVIANVSAERLRANVMDHLVSEAQPEFSSVRNPRPLFFAIDPLSSTAELGSARLRAV
jgi:hypothetical protein